ncbi:hypothetical protein [Rhodococcus ruber]|nr:hypothetical protein [Rhodococcus ruber]AXY51826.1 hypothetical protein YT1_2406 [Rhodococcus ruber]
MAAVGGDLAHQRIGVDDHDLGRRDVVPGGTSTAARPMVPPWS